MREAIAELLDEAATAPVTGWDFTRMSGRIAASPLPWDYAVLADGALRAASTALDLGTGGGEVLDRFPVRPGRMLATESWPPNVPVAARRLAGRGVPVIQTEAAVEDAQSAREVVRFADVGALAWYLRMIPWAVPGFDITAHRPALASAAGQDLVVYQERFLLACRR
jgi:hypothetical protein